jgi:hypothetical protein
MLGTLGAAAAVSGALNLADRTELRLRDPGDAPSVPSFDVENSPEARLALSSRDLRGMVAYTPRLTLWDVNNTGLQPLWLDAGELRGEWRNRHARLAIDEAAAYGALNIATLAPAPGPEAAPLRVDVIPISRMDFASSTTTVSSSLLLRRWSLDSGLGYQLSGGANASSRASLPFQHGPFANARADHLLTRRDHLTTIASASESTFSSGQDAVLLEVEEAWRHRWSRTTEALVTLGAAEAKQRASETAASSYGVLPVVEASVDHGPPRRDDAYHVLEALHPKAEGRITMRLSARVAPVINRLLGDIEERAQVTADVGWRSGPFGLGGMVLAAQSIPDTGPQAVKLLMGTVTLQYRASEWVWLDGGIRGLLQRQAPPAAPAGAPAVAPPATVSQGVVSIGVTVRVPEMPL